MARKEPKGLYAYIKEIDHKEFSNKKTEDPVLDIASIPGTEKPIIGGLEKKRPIFGSRKRLVSA